MAYKNQKKNKKHQAEVRRDNSSYKHAKKKARYEKKHPPAPVTQESLEQELHQRGLI